MRPILPLLLIIYTAAAVDVAAAAHIRAANALIPDLLGGCLLLTVLPRSSSVSVLLGGVLGLLMDALGTGPLGVGMIVSASLVPLIRRALRRTLQPSLVRLAVVTMLAVTVLTLARTAARAGTTPDVVLDGPAVILAAGRGAATALFVLAVALPGRVWQFIRPARRLARS